MKKVNLLASCICAVLMLSSCYSSTVYVGNMKPSTPATKVNTVHHSHFIGGLIGEGTVRGKNYADGAKDYKVKHQLTFVDYLLSGITFGIYTPSTSKVYLPLSAVKSSKKKHRDFDDDEDDD